MNFQVLLCVCVSVWGKVNVLLYNINYKQISLKNKIGITNKKRKNLYFQIKKESFMSYNFCMLKKERIF